ncbi:hypothetical protein KEI82_002495 [Staphylococcus pseudintermedius]|uniref:hypothetical protein n=1 Tax=Staphylococcus pseudintermedius TaxID=283734 RepID=UPI0018F2E9AF|nr:hypothetical protein [Staphylococcus pseudintermedius]EGQ3068521.1 hypothetical protein [Staphylococcus pseudintermedius]EGQ3151796.1 hypothetical protein [Staphylococcus pseudintermedius]EGQ3871487.1 hypothetical protein [Staphylococcus pseudintermedius]EHL7209635.1 hypothetical protein [Staphylococcus pseudintermedius]EHT6215649.1 hypothetical protein [Staphylococcus pseudintermedius]
MGDFFDNEVIEISNDSEKVIDSFNIKEKIKEYSEKRMSQGYINETHKRATFLIDSNTLDKIQNLVDYMEATNALSSKYQNHLTVEQARNERLLAKGFKSKIVNYALDTVIELWESENDIIPNIDKVRYKTKDGTYNRAFRFRKDNVLYYLEQSNRGEEVKFLSTKSGGTEEEINKEFENKLNKLEP